MPILVGSLPIKVAVYTEHAMYVLYGIKLHIVGVKIK